MYRIFQQSVKELGSVKEHKITSSPSSTTKRPFKGYRVFDVNNFSSSENVCNLDKINEMEREEKFRDDNAKKREGFERAHRGCEVYSVNDETRTRRDSEVKNIPRYEGRGHRFDRGFANRKQHALDKGRSSQRGIHINKGKSPHDVSSKKKSKPLSLIEPVCVDVQSTIQGEDWSQDLIDTTVDGNHNVIMKPNIVAEVSLNSVVASQTNAVSIQAVAVEPETLSSGNDELGMNPKDGIMGIAHQKFSTVFDDENNNNYDLLDNDMYGNIVYNYDTASNQESIEDRKFHILITSTETTTENMNEVPQSDSKVIMTGVSEIRNLAPNNQKQTVSESLKSTNVELNFDNFNTNRILEHNSKSKDKDGKNVSEDWSLELDEVDVDLFRLRNAKHLDTPAVVPMNFSLGINEPNNLKSSAYNYSDNSKTDNLKTTNTLKNVDKVLLSVENLHIEDESDSKNVEIKAFKTTTGCTQYNGYQYAAEKCSISSDKYGPINTAEGSLKGTFQKQSTALFPTFETGSGQYDQLKVSSNGGFSSFEKNKVSDELNSQCKLTMSENISVKSECDVKESNSYSPAGERVTPVIREKGSEFFLKDREKVQTESPDTAFDIKVMNVDTSKENEDICDSDLSTSEEILEGLIMCSSPIKVSADSNKQTLQVDCVDQNSEHLDEKESLEIFFKETIDKASKRENATVCESTVTVDRKILNSTHDLVNERKNVDEISSEILASKSQGHENKSYISNIKIRENQEKQTGYYDEQETRRHPFEKNNESLSRKANSDKHYYQQKGQNTVSYSTTASKYSSHHDNNKVPPRFMKKLYLRNANELQNNRIHEKRSVSPYYSPENYIHWDKTQNKDQDSTGTYFGGGGNVNDIKAGGFGNRNRKESVKQRGIGSVMQRGINSIKQREIDKNRHVVPKKLPIQTTNIKAHKQKVQRGEKVAEMDTHIPENWHVEIDEKNRILETTGGVLDVTEQGSKQTVTSKENKFLLPSEAISSERTVKDSNSTFPKPLLAKLKMDEERQDVKNHQHTFISDEKCFDEKEKPYLPPSPDEMEKACFMSYMSKNESYYTCSKVSGKDRPDTNFVHTAKSFGRKDLGTNMSTVEEMLVQSTDSISEKQDMPLSEAAMLDSHLLMFDLQKELEHQARGSESQSLGIQVDYIPESHSLERLSIPMKKNVSEIPVEIDTKKCLVEKAASIDVGDFDSKGSSASDIAKSDKQDFPLDLQSDQGFDTGNVDDTCQEVKESTADKKHFDENDGSKVKISHFRTDYSDTVTDIEEMDKKCIEKMNKKCTEKTDKKCANRSNNVFREVESDDERLIGKTDPFRKNQTHEKAIHYEAQMEMHGEYEKLDYSEMGSWAGGPMPSFTNQFQPAPWQHYHPSYYYTEHYRKWYEQVYVPHYTRYMQYYGYYNVPYESCAHPYYANEKISENGLQTIHEAAEPKLQKPGALFSQTSYNQHKQSETPIIRYMSHSSLLNSEAKEKTTSTDNKLSDYWTEHMPDWVENQSKAAKLKNDTKAADKIAENVAVASNKLERQKNGFPGKATSSSVDSLKQDFEKKNSEHVYKVVLKDESKSISESDKIQPVQSKDINQGINVACSDVELHGLEGKDKRSDVAVKSVENNLSDGVEKRNNLNNEKELKENDSIMDMTASDSNIGLTGTDSDSFTLHQKPGCTCGPDGFQYWLWKTCQCSAGRIPAIEDILPVYPEDRSVDQGYQSYESLGNSIAVNMKSISG